MQNLAREVAAGGGQCLNPRVAVNHTQLSGMAVEKDTIIVDIARHRHAIVSGRARQEQSSRISLPPQPTRLNDRDYTRFGGHGPVLATRASMAAHVPGVDVQTQGHSRIISGRNTQRKVGRPIQETVA
jgi:hypothetical protein